MKPLLTLLLILTLCFTAAVPAMADEISLLFRPPPKQPSHNHILSHLNLLKSLKNSGF